MKRRMVSVLVALLVTAGCSWVSRADVENDGTPGTGSNASPPTLSADGRYVVFVTQSSLDPSDDDGGLFDVYRRDVVAGTTQLVPTLADLNGVETEHDVSADGNLVVFLTADQLEPNDTNDGVDAYVVDIAGETLERVSVATTGEISDQTVAIFDVQISGDGTTVAMLLDYADNTRHLVVRNRPNQTTAEVAAGFDRSLDGITDDGSVVLSAEESRLTRFNLADDTSSVLDCIARYSAISGNGRYVVADFLGGPGCPDGIARYDVETGVYTDALVGHGAVGKRAIGANGRLFGWLSDGTPGTGIELFQSYVHDFANGANQRLSGDMFGNSVRGGSGEPTISADGTVSAFTSTGQYPGLTGGVAAKIIVRRTLRPLAAAVAPSALARGSSRVAVVISGSGFLVPTVDLGPGITVHTATVGSNGTISLDVSVDAAAPPGVRDVVVNNGGAVGWGVVRCPGCVTVT